jgi:hypothetical protein
MTGSRIKNTRPPGIGFLAKGRLWNPPGENTILLPFPISIDAFKEAITRLQSSDVLKELFALLQIPDDARNKATLQLQSNANCKNTCGTELLSDSITLVSENVHYEVEPRWVPFLIIRIST